MGTHLYDQFRVDVEVVLQSKLEEFRLYDYDRITEEELWNYLTTKKWKKTKADVHIYEIVRDILSLKVSDFMSYQTIQHLKAPSWFSEEGADELKELLKK